MFVYFLEFVLLQIPDYFLDGLLTFANTYGIKGLQAFIGEDIDVRSTGNMFLPVDRQLGFLLTVLSISENSGVVTYQRYTSFSGMRYMTLSSSTPLTSV